MNARFVSRHTLFYRIRLLFSQFNSRNARAQKPRIAAFALLLFGGLSAAGVAHAQTRLTQSCNTGWATSVVLQVTNNSPLLNSLPAAVTQPTSNPDLYYRAWQPKSSRTYGFGTSMGISLDYPVVQDMEEIAASIRADAGIQSQGVLSVSTDGPIVCFAAMPPLPNVTVTEYYNSSLDHYVLAVGPDEVALVERGDWGPGWARTGESFTPRVTASACHGVRFVQRFASLRDQWPPSLFYTVKPDVCGYLRNHNAGWRYLADAFGAEAPVNGACSQVYPTPVFQLFNNHPDVNRANHRYTTNLNIYTGMQAQGWIGEGLAFCI